MEEKWSKQSKEMMKKNKEKEWREDKLKMEKGSNMNERKNV